MKVVHLVGGPHCGRTITVEVSQTTWACGKVHGVWGLLSESRTPGVTMVIGVYSPRSTNDAASGRWMWKEPS